MNTYRALIILGALFAPSLSPAQEAQGDASESNMADVCANAACQQHVRVTLKDKDGATFDRTFDWLPPVVQPFGVLVAAGQTVYVEADVVDGKLVNLKAVDKVTRPAKTITATLEQVDGRGMMLSVKNPFDRPIKFSMGIMPLDKDTLFKTSSCPVIAGGNSFEMWPSDLPGGPWQRPHIGRQQGHGVRGVTRGCVTLGSVDSLLDATSQDRRGHRVVLTECPFSTPPAHSSPAH